MPPRHSHFSTLPLHSVSAPVVSNRLMVAPPPDRRRCCRRRCGLTTPSQRDHYPPRPLRATPFRGARRASACLPSSGRSFHHHAAPPRPSVKRATSPLPLKRATSPLPPVDRPAFPFLTSLPPPLRLPSFQIMYVRLGQIGGGGHGLECEAPHLHTMCAWVCVCWVQLTGEK